MCCNMNVIWILCYSFASKDNKHINISSTLALVLTDEHKEALIIKLYFINIFYIGRVRM
jgi:hypothetical protein